MLDLPPLGSTLKLTGALNLDIAVDNPMPQINEAENEDKDYQNDANASNHSKGHIKFSRNYVPNTIPTK